jgi:hypothetical protein
MNRYMEIIKDLEKRMDTDDDDFMRLEEYSEEHMNFANSIFNIYPEKILNLLIPETKKYLQSEDLEMKKIGCIMFNKLDILEENSPEASDKNFKILLDHGMIELFFENLKSKDVDFQLNLISILTPFFPILMKNKMDEGITMAYSKMLEIFKGKLEMHEKSSVIASLSMIIKDSNQVKYPLVVDRYELLTYIHKFLKENTEEYLTELLPLICDVFSETFVCNVEDIRVKEVIDFVLNSIDPNEDHGNNAESLNCLQYVFYCLRLESRPWFKKTFKTCIACLKNNLSQRDLDEYCINHCIILFLIIIQQFNEEVELYIHSTNLIEMMIRLTEMNTLDRGVCKTAISILIELSYFKSKSLEIALPKILAKNKTLPTQPENM